MRSILVCSSVIACYRLNEIPQIGDVFLSKPPERNEVLDA